MEPAAGPEILKGPYLYTQQSQGRTDLVFEIWGEIL